MKTYLKENRFKIGMALALCALGMLGVLDASAAAMGVMFIGDVEPTSLKELNGAMQKAFEAMRGAIDTNKGTLEKAINDLGEKQKTIDARVADDLKKHGEAAAKAQEEAKKAAEAYAARLLEVEQKMAQKPGAGGNGDQPKSAGELFAGSAEMKSFLEKKEKNSSPLELPAGALFRSKAAIMNPVPLSNDNPLVAAQRLPGIIAPATRRLTIRDLLPQITTSQNVIEFARELLATNNAGPQGGGSSPVEAEGQAYGESGITFELANAVVVSLGTWIPASRQILADAPALAGYIDTRLGYFVKLEEEDELLNSSGTAGELNGLRNQATAFNGGVTNATALDTLLRAFTQVELAYFESTGVILHPTDWLNIRLLKDTQGRYLFSDPHNMESPRVWGKAVVPTATMAVGNFLTGAFDVAAAIYDREGASIRVAEQHQDFFVRGLVAILAEERLTLVVYRPAALVGGGLSYAG